MGVRFSVNIPVYNAEKYIEECVASVLNQSFTDFEINIVDDGSTDNSEAICRAFNDSRIHYYKKENEGPLMARVFAVSKSQGEYSVFVDSDDYVDAGYLENIDRIINEENCDMVVCSFKVVTQNGEYDGLKLWNKKTVFEAESIDEFRKAALLCSDINAMWSKITRTEILKSDKTDFLHFARLRNGEDLLQSFHPIFNSGKVVYIPEGYYKYRKNPFGITKTINIERYKDVLTVRNEIYSRLKQSEINDADFLNRYSSMAVRRIIDCVKETAAADCKTERKIAVLKDISENDFYKKIASDFDKKTLDAKSRLIFTLFSAKKYKTLIKMFSVISR